MSISRDTKLAWFDRGAAAFERTAPGLLKTVVGDDSPRYVCPLCDEPFLREAVLSGDLTAEHVPPESFGGRPLVLTCRWCNNTAGTGIDSHARRRENVAEAKSANLDRSLRVRVTLEGLSLQARLESSNSGPRVRIIETANDPANLAKLRVAGVIRAGTRVDINFVGDRYSELSANMSWFRSGFLALFAMAGYGYSFDPAMRIVKDQLRSPDKRLIYSFTINMPARASWRHWSFVELAEPRCTAVMFGSYLLLFPLAGDVDFYQRVEQDARGQESGAPRKTTTGTPYELVTWEPLFGFPISEA